VETPKRAGVGPRCNSQEDSCRWGAPRSTRAGVFFFQKRTSIRRSRPGRSRRTREYGANGGWRAQHAHKTRDEISCQRVDSLRKSMQKREQRRTRPRQRPVVNISEGRSCAGRHCVALQEARHLGILRFVNGRVRRKSSEHKRHSRTTTTWQPEAADAQGGIYARTRKKTTAAVCVSSQEAVCRSRGIKWCHAEPPSSTRDE
jgi:hypothetical protein